jgi:hypothetical protein
VIAVTTPAVDFGAATLGVKVRRTVTIRAAQDLRVKAAWLEPSDRAFEVAALPATLRVGQSADLSVAFRPIEEGRHTAVLRISAGRGRDLLITLRGRGVDGRVVMASIVDFGSPAVGETRIRSLVLRNDGETMVPANIAFLGPDAGELGLASPLSGLAPFSSAVVNLRFQPSGRPGPRRFALRLTACPLCVPETISVQASAVPPALTLSSGPSQTDDSNIQPELPVQTAQMTARPISGTNALGASEGTSAVLDWLAWPIRLAPTEAARDSSRQAETKSGRSGAFETDAPAAALAAAAAAALIDCGESTTGTSARTPVATARSASCPGTRPPTGHSLSTVRGESSRPAALLQLRLGEPSL